MQFLVIKLHSHLYEKHRIREYPRDKGFFKSLKDDGFIYICNLEYVTSVFRAALLRHVNCTSKYLLMNKLKLGASYKAISQVSEIVASISRRADDN